MVVVGSGGSLFASATMSNLLAQIPALSRYLQSGGVSNLILHIDDVVNHDNVLATVFPGTAVAKYVYGSVAHISDLSIGLNSNNSPVWDAVNSLYSMFALESLYVTFLKSNPHLVLTPMSNAVALL